MRRMTGEIAVLQPGLVARKTSRGYVAVDLDIEADPVGLSVEVLDAARRNLSCRQRPDGTWAESWQWRKEMRRDFEAIVGQPFFEAEAIQYVRSIVKPYQPWAMTWTAETKSGMRAYETVDNPASWKVWAEPNPEHDYIVYSDVALARLTDKKDLTSDRDYHYAAVLDRVNFETVAVLHNRIDPGLLGEELLKAGLWYNDAWTGCEVPGAGLVPLERMRTRKIVHRGKGSDGIEREMTKFYPNLYYRGDTPDNMEEREISRLGLEMNSNIRVLVMQALKQAFVEPMLRIYDAGFAKTMVTFAYNKDGKPEARTAFHDDPQMGIGGALYLHQHCPRQVGRRVERVRPKRDAEYVGQSGDSLLRRMNRRVERFRGLS